MRNKIIVFDIDDTLYNEIDYVKSGFKEVEKFIEEKYKIKNTFEDLITLFKESPKNVFNRFFELHDISYTNEEILNIIDIYHKHSPIINLSENVIDTLKELKNNYILAVVSDGNYKVQEKKCRALNLGSYFEKIILTDKLGKEYWKPSKLPFEILSKDFNIDLEKMFYVGDNPNKDFYISQYGIKTIRYYNKNGIYYNDDYKDGIKENYKINNIRELIALLAKIEKLS